jgi:pyridinium-3,5-bisthiocarboxylic acid mononucleotide nickel chelatase
MKVLRFEPNSGIAGDMAMGALLDLGADLEFIKSQVAAVVGDEVELVSSTVMCGAISATDLTVSLSATASPPLRHWKEIRENIQAAPLKDGVRDYTLCIFTALAKAEARVHGVSVDSVHFHEVGAWDSIADIVGIAAALVNLGVDRVETMPVAVGSGFVDTSHGRLPLPAPATAALLEGLPIVTSGLPTELTTPTGAALLNSLATPVEAGTQLQVERTGWGAGKKQLSDRPNALRVWLGSDEGSAGEPLWLLETNLDDSNPEWIGHATERALEAGALDIWLTPIQMKKNRPGSMVSMLCRSEQRAALRTLLFTETSSIGVRERQVSRIALEREIVQVQVQGQPVGIKIARYQGKVVNVAPEFEDLKRVSLATGSSVKDVHAAALAKFQEL